MWEAVIVGDGSNGVERLAVPGGWLYRSEIICRIEHAEHGKPDDFMYAWSVPVFVPDPGVGLRAAPYQPHGDV